MEIRRLTKQGVMRPLWCRCDDGADYIVKSFSSGGAWPLILEWVAARLGRRLGLPIPNYRQVYISAELAEAWCAGGGSYLEAGWAFGSQYVPNPADFDESMVPLLTPDDRTRLLTFDWWIRNSDRRVNNPNLVWSHNEHRHYLIDHEKAGHDGDSAAFWQEHLVGSHTPWLSEPMLAAMRDAVTELDAICQELPSEWTAASEGLPWFTAHLIESIRNYPTRTWRPHE